MNLDNYLPKLNLQTVEFLKKIITPKSLVLETGSGHSTIWFGKQVKRVVALEDDVRWHKLVRGFVRKENLKNVRLYFDPDYSRKQFKDIMKSEDVIEYDIVLHDGPYHANFRIPAMKFIHLFVKAGGYLIVDDTHDKRCAKGVKEHLDILVGGRQLSLMVGMLLEGKKARLFTRGPNEEIYSLYSTFRKDRSRSPHARSLYSRCG